MEHEELGNKQMMARYSGETFKDEHVRLDHSCFIDCIFQNCTVEYSGGDCFYHGCQWVGCTWVWRGKAATTVNLLASMGLLKPPDQQMGAVGSA